MLIPNTTDRDTGGFFAAAAEGRLVYRACDDCGDALHPPTACCPHCGGKTSWHDAKGTATLHSWTTVHQSVHPDYKAPYTLVLVTLDYPARKKQDDALKARNKELKDQYKIEGYPTVLIVDPTTEKEGARSLGFPDEETAAGWISKMKAQLDKVKIG